MLCNDFSVADLHIDNLFVLIIDYSFLTFSFSYNAFSKMFIKISNGNEKIHTLNTCIFFSLVLFFAYIENTHLCFSLCIVFFTSVLVLINFSNIARIYKHASYNEHLL